jgi:hypothetical protein
MTEDEIRERLKDRILLKVADSACLHYATVRRFMKGQGPFCGTTLKALERYLSR